MDSVDIDLVVDMTGGSIAGRLSALNGVPQWNDLHLSRIRRTDDGSLRTTGHMVSRSVAGVREVLTERDASHFLLLDDTSFSGTTNVLAEQIIRKALPERDISITHGFLIANEGDLGPNVPGAIGRLGCVLAGHKMRTPHDDGWHVFDIVQQPNLEEHLRDVERALHDAADEQKLFASSISSDELRVLHKRDEFIPAGQIDGKWHIKNPQLLPRIIAAGHVLPIKSWSNKNEVFDTLLRMGELLKGNE